MDKLFKWLILPLVFSFFSLAISSCGDDEKDEPDYPDHPDTAEQPTDNPDIEEIIIGTWEGIINEQARIMTFTNDGKYFDMMDGYWWVSGSYNISGNAIMLIPYTSSDGYEDFGSYQTMLWTINQFTDKTLSIVDKENETSFILEKANYTQEYLHNIIGTWISHEDDYMEKFVFDKKGTFNREVYINGKLYLWTSGKYILSYDHVITLHIESSNQEITISREELRYYVDSKRLELYIYGDSSSSIWYERE